MTILIAVALHDTVFMIADGRRRNTLEVLTDEAEKLTALQANLTLAVAGAEIGTRMAEAVLKNSAERSLLPLEAQLKSLAQTAAVNVMSMITPETRATAYVNVSLLAGGFDDSGAFLVGALFATNSEGTSSIAVRPAVTVPQFVVLGAEELEASGHFGAQLKAAIDTHGVSGCGNQPLCDAILQAARTTARWAEQSNQTIGGRIQYHLLRAGASTEMGTL